MSNTKRSGFIADTFHIKEEEQQSATPVINAGTVQTPTMSSRGVLVISSGYYVPPTTKQPATLAELFADIQHAENWIKQWKTWPASAARAQRIVDHLKYLYNISP